MIKNKKFFGEVPGKLLDEKSEIHRLALSVVLLVRRRSNALTKHKDTMKTSMEARRKRFKEEFKAETRKVASRLVRKYKGEIEDDSKKNAMSRKEKLGNTATEMMKAWKVKFK